MDQTIVEKMDAAMVKAEAGNVYGRDFKLAENPYNPHEASLGQDTRNMDKIWGKSKPKGITAKKLRETLYSTYNIQPQVLYLLKNKIKWLNQGPTGGCFLTSLINLLQIDAKTQEVNKAFKTLVTNPKDSITISQLGSAARFRKLYIDQMNLEDDGYNNYYDPFHVLNEAIPELMALTTNIEYQWFRLSTFPIRKRSILRKGAYNPEIGGDNIDEYNQNILAFLRQLLDNGYVFAVPFVAHFIVYVGYNENGFLALGSYGPSADRGGFHEVKETINLADAIKSVLYLKVPDNMEALTEQLQNVNVRENRRRQPSDNNNNDDSIASRTRRRRTRTTNVMDMELRIKF